MTARSTGEAEGGMAARAGRLLAMARDRGVATTLNHVAAAIAVRRRPRVVRSWPRFLQFEVTSRCNMACAQCSRSTLGVPARQGHMSLTLFESLLGQFHRYQSVTLHGLGEPLLNPELPAMVKAVRARSAHVRVGFNTNGLRLTPDLARSLAEAGLDEIGVSLDAASSDTHRAVRGGGFEEIVARVRAVCASREPRPAMALALVVMEPNIGELVQFVELGKSLGVDRVSLCDLSMRWRAQGADPMAVRSLDAARQNSLEAERRAREAGLPFWYTRLDRALWPDAFIPCFYLWDYPYITWEGRLTPCCALPYAEHSLGDLRATPFRRLWNGPAYRAMRAALVSGRIPPPCANCHHASPEGPP
ncbi:MAG: radical SAM protein [Candidatus Eisenbacteria bacterium]|nr:radical SAM protein [Candidatus Eisenbacteria bacterium]